MLIHRLTLLFFFLFFFQTLTARSFQGTSPLLHVSRAMIGSQASVNQLMVLLLTYGRGSVGAEYSSS